MSLADYFKKLFSAISFILKLENELSHLKADIDSLRDDVKELRGAFMRLEERIDNLYELIIEKLK